MSFAIVTDTSANLPTPMAQESEIRVLPLSYNEEGREQVCLDTECFDSDAYYARMKAGAKITTSQINPQNYIDCMAPLLQEGKNILFVGMSSGISGTFHSAQIAAQQLMEEYPERKICTVDTLGASLGEGLQVLWARDCREQGMSLEETAELLNTRRAKMAQIFTVDDLNHLRRGGRLSNAAAIVGTILNIKPVLKGNEEGKIVSFEKTRGRKAVIARLAQKYNTLAVEPETQLVGISHCGCREDAEKLAAMLRENRPPKDILIVDHEPVTGSYLGPGALALYFEGNAQVRAK